MCTSNRIQTNKIEFRLKYKLSQEMNKTCFMKKGFKSNLNFKAIDLKM
jgi:hypothetical protein